MQPLAKSVSANNNSNHLIMSKREEVKDLERAAFATAYVDNGFNGKQAALAIKPHLTERSAEVMASDYLSTPEVQERVSAITEQTRQVMFASAERAIKSIWEREMQDPDPEIRAIGLKYLKEFTQIFSPEAKMPKTANQKNVYNFPSKKQS